MRESVGVIIAAAGRGKRFGREKQFIPLKRRPLYFYSIERFSKIKEVKEIVIVVPKDRIKSCKRYIDSKKIKKQIRIVEGKNTRTESVRVGLSNIFLSSVVLIHDAVRPFPSISLITRVIKETKRFGACVPVIKITDTLKIIENGYVRKTLPRKNVFKAQTPQGFKKSIILKAYSLYKGDFLDDSSIVELIGKKVKTTTGEVTNFKITFPYDYQLAKKLVGER